MIRNNYIPVPTNILVQFEQTALGWALPPLVKVALGAAHRKARNGDLLASKRVPLVLAMEESAGRTEKACDPWGGSGFDSQAEFGKSALGRIASG